MRKLCVSEFLLDKFDIYSIVNADTLLNISSCNGAFYGNIISVT